MRWLVVIVAVTRVAAADPPDRAKATAHFRQGQAYFKVADYDHAIAEYEAAYALSNEPLLIFNIGLCHDRAKRPEKALDAFQRYLATNPTGDVADEAREDVARLTPIVDELHRAADQARQADAARRAQAEHDAEVAERQRRDAAEQQRHRAELEARAEPLAHRAFIERLAAYSLAGLTVVTASLATKYALGAQSAANDITNHQGPWTDQVLARDADGRSAQTRARIYTAVAVGAAISSGVMFVLSRRDAHAANELRVEVKPGGAAVSLARSF